MTRRVDPPTVEQVEQLAAVAPTPAFRAFVLVSAWSGLRLNEVSKLDYDDVTEAEDGTARVLVRRGKGGTRLDPKSRTSVLFPPGLQAIHDAGGLPLLNQRRNRYSRQTVSDLFGPMREAIGRPDIVFHDLRIAHATWLLNQGVSELDVAVQLGHLDKWGRPNPELVRKVYGRPNLTVALERVALVA